MIDLVSLGMNAAISFLSVFFGVYVGSKIMKKEVKTEVFEAIPEFKARFLDYLHTEEGQKVLFTVGALVGNGIKTGLGLQKISGGKFKWEDIAVKIAAGFIEKQFPGLIGEQSSSEASKETDSLKPPWKK